MTLLRPLALLVVFSLALPAFGAAPEPAELAPLEFPPASLVVEGATGTTAYDRATLEDEFRTYRLVTTTPWRPDPATFEGVMLNDLLARHDLDTARGVKVTAENDFQVVIPAEILTSVPILVATRVDGQPHTRRARGPLQFVIPMDVYERLDLTERYWVWMAARIEAAD